MTSILQSLSKTVHLSLGIAILLLIILHFFGDGFAFDRYFFSWLFRYLHVLTGIMWIGLLWYFNFVQIPSMPNIPDEQKPAIGKVIAPKALFWFRWAALGTIITGLGIFVVLLLVSYEIQDGKICLYCTTAHIANIAALIGFFRLGKLFDDKSAWKA